MRHLLEKGLKRLHLKRSIFNNVVQAGTINYFWRNKKLSLRRDTLFLFDLELPKNIIPINNDGEVSKFNLYSSDKVIDKIKHTNDFKKTVH